MKNFRIWTILPGDHFFKSEPFYQKFLGLNLFKIMKKYRNRYVFENHGHFLFLENPCQIASFLFSPCEIALLFLFEITMWATLFILKYKMFYPIIDMHLCRHLLVSSLEVKRVNLYNKKHLDTCMSIIG
jgi:hypothetical protein